MPSCSALTATYTGHVWVRTDKGRRCADCNLFDLDLPDLRANGLADGALPRTA